MSLAEKLIESFNKLPIARQKEVIDFVDFLTEREQKKLEKMMDEIICENKEAFDELGR